MTTTAIDKLSVDPAALAAYGRERCEDAWVCHAVIGYLADVAAIPAQAFGTIPEYSDAYRADWASLVEARTTECRTIRDELWAVGSTLIQIAADYANTDINAAYDIELTVDALAQYVDASLLGQPELVIDQKGMIASPFLYEPHRPETLSAEVAVIRNEPLAVMTVDDTPTIATSTGFGGPERTFTTGLDNDELHRFLFTEYRTLAEIEYVMEQFGVPNERPLSQLMIHAWVSSPTIIGRRAELIALASESVRERMKDFAAATTELERHWSSPKGGASDAFYAHAGRMAEYMGYLADEILWLAERGLAYQFVLQDLRGSYAGAGAGNIAEAKAALTEYGEAVGSLVDPCNEKKDLYDAMVTFASAVEGVKNTKYRTISDLAQIQRDQFKNDYLYLDKGSLSHQEARKLPESIIYNDDWKNPKGWRPSD